MKLCYHKHVEIISAYLLLIIDSAQFAPGIGMKEIFQNETVFPAKKTSWLSGRGWICVPEDTGASLEACVRLLAGESRFRRIVKTLGRRWSARERHIGRESPVSVSGGNDRRRNAYKDAAKSG